MRGLVCALGFRAGLPSLLERGFDTMRFVCKQAEGSHVKSKDGIDEWRSVLPSHVVQKSEELLARVGEMRINQVIYPPQDDVLNALASCAPSEVRAVILGQDPYHGPNQAMGLSFSVPAGEKLPPSLRNIYKEMASDLGCGIPKSGDLTPWAKQGVLLLNTTLTVREHEAASHAKLGWQLLTSHVVKACFELPQPVVFLAWGRHAQQLIEKAAASAGVGQDIAAQAALRTSSGALGPLASGELCPPDGSEENGSSALCGVSVFGDNKFVLASTHPSPLSASRAAGGMPAFLGSRPFSKANALLLGAGAAAIDWASLA